MKVRQTNIAIANCEHSGTLRCLVYLCLARCSSVQLYSAQLHARIAWIASVQQQKL